MTTPQDTTTSGSKPLTVRSRQSSFGDVGAIIYIFAILTCFLQQLGLMRLAPRGFLIFGLIVGTLFVMGALRQKSVQPLGPAAIIFYYMWFIGFGVPLASLVAPQAFGNSRITNSPYYTAYLSLSLLATSAFALGAHRNRKQTKPSPKPTTRRLEFEFGCEVATSHRRLVGLGMLLIALFALYLTPLYLLGGVPTAYSAFKDWAGNRFFVYSKYGFWFGSVILACYGSPRQVRFGLLVGSMPAAVLLLTGNRNDVLYPLLIALGIYSLRLGRRPWKSLLVVFLAILTLGPVIASSRESGVSLAGAGSTVPELVAASLAELGAQARPVMIMLGWLAEGESYQYGGTYLFPTFALLEDSIGNQVGRPSLDTFSLATRLPGLGFSMPGELYFNFGPIGVLLGYLVTGRLLLSLERKSLASASYLAYGLVSFALLLLQRNSFQLLTVVITMVAVLLLLERWTRLKR